MISGPQSKGGRLCSPVCRSTRYKPVHRLQQSSVFESHTLRAVILKELARVLIAVLIDSVFATEQDSIRNEAEGIGSNVIPFFVCRESEVVALLLIACNSFFGQYPDVMLFVFRYLVDQVVKKRVRIIRLVFVSLQLVSVELSQSCFGAYPDETLFVSEDAAYIGRQSFFEGDLLIVVMFCAEREGSYQ